MYHHYFFKHIIRNVVRYLKGAYRLGKKQYIAN